MVPERSESVNRQLAAINCSFETRYRVVMDKMVSPGCTKILTQPAGCGQEPCAMLVNVGLGVGLSTPGRGVSVGGGVDVGVTGTGEGRIVSAEVATSA